MRENDKRRLANMRVKLSITKAFFNLLKTEKLSSITVTELVREAGVSRESFYRNFGTMEAIVDDFFERLHAEVLSQLEEKEVAGFGYDAIVTILGVLKTNREQILALNHGGFASRNLESIEGFMALAAGDMPTSSVERFQLDYLAGGLYNTALKWLEEGCRIDCEIMAAAICEFKATNLSSITLDS